MGRAAGSGDGTLTVPLDAVSTGETLLGERKPLVPSSTEWELCLASPLSCPVQTKREDP